MSSDLASLRGKAKRLVEDFPYFAEHCLKIRPKAGGLRPLKLNAVQQAVHDRLEAQRKETGKVRALVLKARQPGVSTYVEGRFFWKVTQTAGIASFILTHQQKATDGLFGMTQRFFDNLPEPLKPKTVTANAKELHLAPPLDSSILVSTAGSKGAGRGGTIQLFHGSEVAFWQDAATHMGGVLQAVPDLPDTEVILESTANGVGGLFYTMWREAERGQSEYQAIFIPWFQHGEYETEPSEDWEAPEDFSRYGELHGLTPSQLYWAWRKNSEMAQAIGAGNDEICWFFRQEYPATSAEAFQLSGHESYVRAELVLKARKWTAESQSHMPLTLGVDVARGGGDITRIVSRQGRVAGHVCDETIDSRDLMDVAGRVALEIERVDPDAVFVDVTGIGAGVYDKLKERGFRGLHAVNFGSKAREEKRYANKRAEIWARTAEWFRDEGGADIPDEDEWQASLCAPGYQFDSNSRLLMEPKEKIKARVGFSPDVGDALALTFAETVKRKQDMRHLPTHTDDGGYDPLRW